MSSLTDSRSHYKPFVYPWAFEAYDTMQKMHWLPRQVPLGEDTQDWNTKLSQSERDLLTQVFRFFVQADVDVAGGYFDRFLPEFRHPEVRMMLSAFATSEANHVHSYSLLLDTIGMPETEYQAFQQYKEMRDKHEYMFEHDSTGLSKDRKLALDMAIFSAFGEGMQLFSSFAILMNFQRLGTMKGMATIVEWSIRDESHHVESMVKLFHTFIGENPHIWTDTFKKRIYEACREMVRLEDSFIDLAFEGGGVKGMTPQEVKAYIRYIADRRLNQLGLKSNYGIDTNPFDWLDWIIGAETHTNFFEGRATEYAKASVEGWDEAFE